jgi:hypothetical protein
MRYSWVEIECRYNHNFRYYEKGYEEYQKEMLNKILKN